jgi:lipopolysaccharide transport system ATP-binding protein
MTALIRLEGVSKRYRLYHQKPYLSRTLLHKIMQRPTFTDEHWALRDVSFTVARGESIAVVGRNGAGKSTLLSLIARTSYPTSGTVEVNGKVGPMLELGSGFHPDLTGYENIFLNGILLGMTRRAVEAALPSIIEYSELGQFIDTPISTYSIGMRARLGFSVVAHLDPDILLLDEVLGVGDGHFRAKCEHTLRSFKERGKTLFLVTHTLGGVSDLCERTLWIDGGRLRASGPTREVLPLYEKDLGVAPTPPPKKTQKQA